MNRTAWLSALAVLAMSTAAAAIEVAPAGAAACSGCHPVGRSVETSFVRLAGRDPADMLKAMQEFRSGQRPATVMDRIAKGFSDHEVAAIAAWYAAQKD
jgi:cytochrome c553